MSTMMELRHGTEQQQRQRQPLLSSSGTAGTSFRHVRRRLATCASKSWCNERDAVHGWMHLDGHARGQVVRRVEANKAVRCVDCHAVGTVMLRHMRCVLRHMSSATGSSDEPAAA